MTVVSGTQIHLNFTPGLSEQHVSLLDCLNVCARSQQKPLKAIAADMEMSPSELSRKLSGNLEDSRRFTVSDLEAYIQTTGDTTPILYLAQKFCVDSATTQKHAINALAALTPQLIALLKEAGVSHGTN